MALSEHTAFETRKKLLEKHVKLVASHSSMPLSDSQLLVHMKEQECEEYLNGKENDNPNDDDDIHLRTITKKRLKRLGVLYSDEGTISSPIQRTEMDFNIEDDENREDRPSARSEARSARLARLAETINQWEDDLSHPSISKPEPIQYDKFGNVRRTSPTKRVHGKPPLGEVNKINDRQTKKKVHATEKHSGDNIISKKPASATTDISTSNNSTTSKESLKRDAERVSEVKPKRVMWDSTVIASLESQGFERCESKEHLVYDYKEQQSPAKCISGFKGTPKRTEREKSASPVKNVQVSPKKPPVSSPSKSRVVSQDDVPSVRKQAMLTAAIVQELTPTKVDKKSNPINQNSTISRVSGSPSLKAKSPSPRKNTQVLEMAAQYEESTSPSKKVKETDPSELPLSQRMALFEKNKGSAILPKAPLVMNVPAKMLAPSHEVVSTPIFKKTPSSPARGESSEQKLKKIKEERQKEIDSLKNRWEQRKQAAQESLSTISSPPPPRSPYSSYNVNHEVEHNKIPAPPPMPAPVIESQVESSDEEMSSPVSMKSTDTEYSRCPNTAYPMLKDVKKIRLSPPKPGRLYPSISDIETETESETQDNNNMNSGYEQEEESMDESDTSSQSLGETIIKVANRSTGNLKRHNESTSEEEARILGEIDDFLDEALGEPSPSKRSKDSSFDYSEDCDFRKNDSGSVASDSFEFGRSSDTISRGNSSSSVSTSSTQPSTTQLVHTISLYRKQKQMTLKTTTTVKREKIVSYDESMEDNLSETSIEMEQKEVEKSEEQLVSDKIHELLLEISKQQTVISQATQALNLCSSTIEFSGSAEQTEAEKLLLIASQRRLALNHEVDRLRVEKKLRPNGGGDTSERGDLTIHNMSLPLRMDVIRSAARDEKCFYVVILVRSGPTVISSEMLPAFPKNLKQTEPYILNFKAPITLKQLYSDFTVTLEVYTLETRSKELLPHDIKYHITPSAKKTFVMPPSLLAYTDRVKEKLKMTPKKASKNDTRLIMGPIESPGGPLAVRSSSFKLSGFAVFSLREINKSSFTLSKVSYGGVVEGSVQLRMSCEMTLEGLEYRGFLTLFQDVSGFGAWHRRWCYLKDNTISFWLYPEHETSKIPLDTIDLTECCNDGEVGLVSRDICARPNTFLLEVSRSRLPTDQDSLVMKTSKHTTLIRHLMSADTREDRLEWCSRINKCLALLKAWGKRPTMKHTSL